MKEAVQLLAGSAFLRPRMCDSIPQLLHVRALLSTILTKRQVKDADDDKQLYLKEKGYSTVRFPYSGLVGTDEAKAKTKAWNEKFTTAEAVDILNQNVSAWINEGIQIPPEKGVVNPDTYSTGARYKLCLDAPNYMVFSNKTSAEQYMTDHDINVKKHIVVALEDPHNAVHLSIGGINQ